MKKIIAISVMLVLVAGSVFAETTIGGAVEVRFQPAKQQGAKTDKPISAGQIGAAQIVLTGSNGDGTLGGRFRYKHTAWQAGANFNNGQNYDQVYVWWKPIEQVKIFLGIDQDGLFDTASIAGWSYHAGDNDYIFNHHWDFWRQIFPGNWDGFGLALSLYPIQGLDVNLVIPTGNLGWRQAPRNQVEKTRPLFDPDSTTYTGLYPGFLRFSAGYAIDAGKISLVYIGGHAVSEKSVQFGSAARDNNGLFGASFLLTAIDGIQVLVGGSAVITDPDPLISGGLGFVWNGDGFGVKARAGLVTQGDAKPLITGSVMPFVAVGEKGQFLLDIVVTQDGNKVAPVKKLGWGVYPAYRLSIEGGAFKIGFSLYNNLNTGGNIGISGADYVKWNIPMLLSFNF